MQGRQTAIVAGAGGDLIITHDAMIPSLEPDMVLVKTHAVALNPVDSKMVGKLATPGAIAGFDLAGSVVAVGPQAKTPLPLKIGDRVCGSVHGMHSLTPAVGAFAEYVTVLGHVLFKIPDGMSFEDAATFGVGVGTVGLALFRSMKLPFLEEPALKPPIVLVHGGSTASGTLAIQLLILAGVIPIATCSPRNFDLVRQYGAASVFDYKSTSCVQDIKTCTKGALAYALDCVADPEAMIFCYQCIGRAGGRYTALEPFLPSLSTRKTVKPDWVLFMEVFGKNIAWHAPFKREGNEEIQKWATNYYKKLQKLLTDGKLKPHPIQMVDGGFSGILTGLEMIRNKEISGVKLVCQIV